MSKKETATQAPKGDHEDSPYPYPTLLDTMPAIRTVTAKLRGEDVELNCLIHCGYTVQGFALSQVFPHDHPIHGENGKDDNPNAMNTGKVNVQNELEKVQLAEENGVAFGPVPWLALALQIAQLLLDWAKNQS